MNESLRPNGSQKNVRSGDMDSKKRLKIFGRNQIFHFIYWILVAVGLVAFTVLSKQPQKVVLPPNGDSVLIAQLRQDTAVLRALLIKCRQDSGRTDRPPFNADLDICMTKDSLAKLYSTIGWLEYQLSNGTKLSKLEVTGGGGYTAATSGRDKQSDRLIVITMDNVSPNEVTFHVKDRLARIEYDVHMALGRKTLDTTYAGNHVVFELRSIQVPIANIFYRVTKNRQLP